MAPIDDKVLEKLLKRHLSSRLEGQVGRAEAAFRQQRAEAPVTSLAPAANADVLDVDVSSPSSAPLRLVDDSDVLPHAFQVSRWGGMGRFFGVAGTAIAASLATLLLLPQFGLFKGTPKPPGGQVSQGDPTPIPPGHDKLIPMPSEEHPLVRYVHNSAWDEGTVTPDESGTPMRRVRYQQVERVRYFDPQRQAMVEVIVPRENVQHYQLDSY